jgi:hypothetical protein
MGLQSARLLSVVYACLAHATCAGDRRPWVDEDGLVHWPALFFYPEASMQHDVVDDVCEEDTLRWAGRR